MVEYLVFHTFFFAVICYVVLLLDRASSIFTPAFWYLSFHGLVFVMKPLLFIVGDFDFVFSYIGFYPDNQKLAEALFISDVALVCFLAGSYIRLGWKGRAIVPLDLSAIRTSGQIYSFVIASLIVMPLIAISLLKAGAGFSYDGSTGHHMEMIDGISINVNTTGYLTELKNMMTPFAFLVVVVFGLRRWVLVLLVLYFSYRLYLGWERIHLVVLVMNLVLLYLAVRGKRWFSPAFAVVAICTLPLFSFLGENRDYFKSFFGGDAVERTEFHDPGVLDGLDNLDFANYEYLVYIISVVPEYSQSYTYWTQYLQLFTEPVPRIIWSGKPVGMPIKLVNLNEWGNFVGLTKSSVGDAWMSFGYLGVVINLFLIGYFLAFLFEKLFLNGDVVQRVMWLMLIPFSMQLFRDGGAVTIMKFLLFASLPYIFWRSIVFMGLRETR